MGLITRAIPWTKKPISPRLDRGHWFGKHIQSAIIPNNFNGEYDVAIKSKATLTGATSEIRNDSYYAGAANTDYLDLGILPFSAWTQATIFIRFKLTSASAAGRIYSTQYSGADDIRIYQSGTSIIVTWDDGTITNQTFTSLPVGTDIKAIISHDGATQRSWFYNADTKTLSSQSNADTYSFSGTGGLTYLTLQAGGSVGCAGDVYYCYVADKAITTTAEAKSLIEHEYSMLAPRRVYFPTQEPVGGGLGIPIAMYHYSHNVGSKLYKVRAEYAVS